MQFHWNYSCSLYKLCDSIHNSLFTTAVQKFSVLKFRCEKFYGWWQTTKFSNHKCVYWCTILGCVAAPLQRGWMSCAGFISCRERSVQREPLTRQGWPMPKSGLLNWWVRVWSLVGVTVTHMLSLPPPFSLSISLFLSQERENISAPLGFDIVGGWELSHPIFISEVVPDSKAAEAGVRSGDMVSVR